MLMLLIDYSALQTSVYSPFKGLPRTLYIGGRGYPQNPAKFGFLPYLAAGRPVVRAKYSHGVWEHFPHPANPILGTSFFDIF